MSPNISPEVQPDAIAYEERAQEGESRPAQRRPGAVAILVLDDFDLVLRDPYGGEEMAATQANEYCTVTPDGQGVYGSQGAGVYGSQGASGFAVIDVPHGVLVYQKFIQMLGNPQPATKHPPLGVDWIGETGVWTIGGQELYILQVDTLGFDTDTVSDRIDGTITLLNAEWGIDRFVLNMSFAVVPCNLLGLSESNYEQMLSGDKELEELSDELADLVGLGTLSQDKAKAYLFGQVILHQSYPGEEDLPIDDQADPLFGQLKNYAQVNRAIRVISVAAAGNHGLPFPFAPARWPGVVSVSACGTWIYRPNLGEVAMGDHVVYDGYIIRGTSFAAPELSYQQARYLMAGYDVGCSGGQGVQTRPPLSYSDADSLDRNWRNYTLAQAAANYCPVFPFR